jgi:hypothetical protein
MKKERVLAIDDCRKCCGANVLCRTFNDGIMALDLMGPWNELELDHDLGEEKTGLDILRWLNKNPDKYPETIYIITANPVGLKNMVYELQDSGIMEKVNGYERQWKKIKE